MLSKFVVSTTLLGTTLIIPTLSVQAQIIPDNSLGNENSVVVPNININGLDSDRIDGGAIRGSNLFHSFQEFNIDNGRGAYFSNPETISNILTRVTGNNISNIFGTLGVLGNANTYEQAHAPRTAALSVNLFLINPNGIVFGPNARLDVSGSFFASTADSTLFENGIEFAASNPEAAPLLTINIPIGLNFRENPGNIVNQSVATDDQNRTVGLQVPRQKTIALIGGNIFLEGGKITAEQGQVELGSVGEKSRVQISPLSSSNYHFIYENIPQFRDIILTQKAEIETSGEGGGAIRIQGGTIRLNEESKLTADTIGNQNGEGIFIQANQLMIQDGSQVSASASEESQGKSGGIQVNVVESVEIIGTSPIGSGGNSNSNPGNAGGSQRNSNNNGNQNNNQSNGNSEEQLKPSKFASDARGSNQAGDLIINTQALILRDGAKISASTIEADGGGNIFINASDFIQVIGTSIDGRRSSGISVQTRGNGRAGDITINTNRLILQDGAEISASTFGDGDSGTININASQLTELTGVSNIGELPSRIIAETGEPRNTVDVGVVVGTGRGGDLNITTPQLIVQDGARISASTFGEGNAGNLNIQTNQLNLQGISTDTFFRSGLFTLVETGASGNGGTLNVNTQRLVITEGAEISAATFGNGNSGNLIIKATEMELIGISMDGNFVSAIAASVELGAMGKGGNLSIDTQRLTIRDGAQIDVRSEGTEAAGNLMINAPNIFLDNQASLNGETTAGEGDIILNTEDLRLRNNSNITTNATGEATGGNITINTETLTAIENSDISANAEDAFGGRVTINAVGVFGTAFRTQQSQFSDITATSELGPEFSGTVELNTELDPSSGLIDLTQTVTDPNDLIAQEFCRQRGSSDFVVRGRGGIAVNPNDKSDGNQINVDLVEPVPTQPQNTSQKPAEINNNPAISSLDIIPARGWIRDENGDVILVSYDPTKTGVQRQQRQLPDCQPE